MLRKGIYYSTFQKIFLIFHQKMLDFLALSAFEIFD